MKSTACKHYDFLYLQWLWIHLRGLQPAGTHHVLSTVGTTGIGFKYFQYMDNLWAVHFISSSTHTMHQRIPTITVFLHDQKWWCACNSSDRVVLTDACLRHNCKQEQRWANITKRQSNFIQDLYGRATSYVTMHIRILQLITEDACWEKEHSICLESGMRIVNLTSFPAIVAPLPHFLNRCCLSYIAKKHIPHTDSLSHSITLVNHSSSLEACLFWSKQAYNLKNHAFHWM